MRIYHNPRCRKSREALTLLHEKGADPQIVEYLKTPPTTEELSVILNKMGKQAEEIIRKNEQVYKENFKGKTLTNEEWIQVLVDNPILIERPIVIEGEKAVLGRPPENVLELL